MKYIYKIVAALGALSVCPLIVFLDIIYYKISSAALGTLFYIGQLFGNETITQAIEENNGTVPEAIADTVSLYDLYGLFSSASGLANSGNITEKLEVLVSPAILAGVVLILIALCAVVTAVFAIVAKDNRKVIYSSVAGIGLSLIFKECFAAIAEPILDGTVSIATLMDSAWGDLIGEFEKFTLTTNFWFIPAVFGAIILWTVIYNYTLPDKEKRERKLMLGEADDQ
ncbi:MAG: hypothetical protein ACI4VW_01825 [Acutalibacteraceae bacterium]